MFPDDTLWMMSIKLTIETDKGSIIINSVAPGDRFPSCPGGPKELATVILGDGLCTNIGYGCFSIGKGAKRGPKRPLSNKKNIL